MGPKTLALLLQQNTEPLLTCLSTEGTNNRGCMQRICIFCGSQAGTNDLYRQAAIALGRLLARQGYGLVYGGGSVGLMGIIADAVLAEKAPA